MLVLTNPGEAGAVSLRLNDRAAQVSLEPDSLTTLVWS